MMHIVLQYCTKLYTVDYCCNTPCILYIIVSQYCTTFYILHYCCNLFYNTIYSKLLLYSIVQQCILYIVLQYYAVLNIICCTLLYIIVQQCMLYIALQYCTVLHIIIYSTLLCIIVKKYRLKIIVVTYCTSLYTIHDFFYSIAQHCMFYIIVVQHYILYIVVQCRTK